MLRDLMSYKLAKVSSSLSHATARIYYSELGLKTLDWRIIVALKHEGPASANDVASMIDADKGNISRSVAKLKASGLIRKLPEKDGPRKALLQITDKGNDIFNRINPIARARETKLLASLTPEEHGQLGTLLDKLIDRLATMD